LRAPLRFLLLLLLGLALGSFLLRFQLLLLLRFQLTLICRPRLRALLLRLALLSRLLWGRPWWGLPLLLGLPDTARRRLRCWRRLPLGIGLLR
jgi:hypothetical protein